MVEEMTPDEWILGKGLGGMFYSKLGYWANAPHITVLVWLQKGGVPLFLIVLATVYIAPSLGFFRQLSRPRRTSPLPPPILIVGPMLLSWCALTFVSGGTDTGSFLALGGLTYLWIQLTDDEKVFEWHRRNAGSLPYGMRPAEVVREVVGAA
jgi:O-antigen ligase